MSDTKPAYPDQKRINAGIIICWMLCVFDVLLGGVATFASDIYLDILHANLEHPQYDLVRRTGLLWLAFAAIALRAATARGDMRSRWFLVLGCMRLIEVPADILYGVTASGATTIGHALILAAPPANLLLGGYLVWLSRAMSQGANPLAQSGRASVSG